MFNEDNPVVGNSWGGCGVSDLAVAIAELSSGGLGGVIERLSAKVAIKVAIRQPGIDKSRIRT